MLLLNKIGRILTTNYMITTHSSDILIREHQQNVVEVHKFLENTRMVYPLEHTWLEEPNYKFIGLG
jgi:hypothetical protein